MGEGGLRAGERKRGSAPGNVGRAESSEQLGNQGWGSSAILQL